MADSPFVGAGVFWISSRTNDEDVFPYKDFVRWYEDVHIPDVVHADPEKPLPVARRLPSHPSAPRATPRGWPIARFASFLGRFARYVETWGSGGESGSLLLSEVTEFGEFSDTPDVDVDTDAIRQYRDEYMHAVATLPGWQRSTRFEVVMENEIGGDKVPPPDGPAPSPSTAKKPRWLTLHEFDAAKTKPDHLTSSTTSLLGTTEATRRMEAAASFVEVLPFHLVRTYGDEAAAFADGDVRKL